MYLPPPHLTARVRINSIDPARTAIEAWLGTRVRFSSSSAQPHESQTFRVVSAEAAWIMGSRFLRDLQGISCALIGLVLRRSYRGSKSLSPILDAQNVVGSMAPAPAECKSLEHLEVWRPGGHLADLGGAVARGGERLEQRLHRGLGQRQQQPSRGLRVEEDLALHGAESGPVGESGGDGARVRVGAAGAHATRRPPLAAVMDR